MRVSTFITNLNLNRQFYEQCPLIWLREEAKSRGIRPCYLNKSRLIQYLSMYDNIFKTSFSSTVLRIYLDPYYCGGQYKICEIEPNARFWRGKSKRTFDNLIQVEKFVRQWKKEKILQHAFRHCKN